MFEQRRCQRGATREDKVPAVLRLDAANALDDVRSKALERTPCKTFRTVCRDVFRCRIEAVRHRTARLRRHREAFLDRRAPMRSSHLQPLNDGLDAGVGPNGSIE